MQVRDQAWNSLYPLAQCCDPFSLRHVSVCASGTLLHTHKVNKHRACFDFWWLQINVVRKAVKRQFCLT